MTDKPSEVAMKTAQRERFLQLLDELLGAAWGEAVIGEQYTEVEQLRIAEEKRESARAAVVNAWQAALDSYGIEELRQLDGKFSVHPTKGIVNTVSGETIPEDEPLFLLRGRDHHALEAIQAYRSICANDCNELHLDGISQAANKFAEFRIDHPERMKQPGVTRHLKLDEPTPASEIANLRGQLAEAQREL